MAPSRYLLPPLNRTGRNYQIVGPSRRPHLLRSVGPMRNLTRRTAADPESMDELLGDCARMAPHWTEPAWALHIPADPGAAAVAPASYEALHGVRVPAASARVLEGMSEYGVW